MDGRWFKSGVEQAIRRTPRHLLRQLEPSWFLSGQITSLLASAAGNEAVREDLGGMALTHPGRTEFPAADLQPERQRRWSGATVISKTFVYDAIATKGATLGKQTGRVQGRGPECV